MAKSTVRETVEVVRDPVSGRQLTASLVRVGDDLVVVVGGGDRPHVGCVVLAQPVPSRSRPGQWSASCSVVTVAAHKEEPVARTIAECLCAASGRVVVVTAGVHEDGLDQNGISTYLDLARRLAQALVGAG